MSAYISSAGTGAVDLHVLDREAEAYLDPRHRLDLAAWAAEVPTTDFRGHPRARLVAALVLADANPADPEAERTGRAALRSMQRSRDHDGVSLGYAVLGRLAEMRGDLAAAADNYRRAGVTAPPSLDTVSLVGLGLQAWNANALGAAQALGEVTEELARDRSSLAARARAAGLLGTLAAHEGRFGDADRILSEVLAEVGEIPDAALAHTILGTIEQRRGHTDAAARHFDEAMRLGPGNHDVEARASVAAVCAEYHTRLPATSRLEQAWSAVAATTDAEDWARHTALRAVAVAAREAGDDEAADSVLETLLSETAGYERGRALLLAADRPIDPAEQAALLEEAYAVHRAASATYYAALAAIRRSALAAADGDEAGAQRWRDRAVEQSNGDLAFLRLLETGHDLALDAGDGVLHVRVDDRPVSFLTRHAELTCCLLAVAGREGVEAEALARRLWPGVQQRRWRPRLRTCLWQVRKAIEPEGWRLRRHGNRVYLDVADLDVDTEALTALADTFEL